MSADRNTWETPQSVVDAVAEFMGEPPMIDLCASRENAKARYWIGKDDRSLPPWVRRSGVDAPGLLGYCPREMAAQVIDRPHWAWCNPPYSAADILPICEWLAQYAHAGGVAALLVNLDESTRWARTIYPQIRARLVVQRRIQFIPPPGVAPSSNSKCQSIYILGPRRPWDPDAYPSHRLNWPEDQKES